MEAMNPHEAIVVLARQRDEAEQREAELLARAQTAERILADIRATLLGHIGINDEDWRLWVERIVERIDREATPDEGRYDSWQSYG